MAGAPRRPLVAGNWKMNGLSGSAAELARIIQGARGAGSAGRPHGVPAGDAAGAASPRPRRAVRSRSAARTATPSRQAPSPAICRPKCSRMPAPAPSSSGIPSGAPITRKPMRTCAPRRWPPGAPDCCAIVCVGETRTEREDGRALAVVGSQLAWFAARRRDSPEPGRCLRAGLGDRHRADADARRRRRDARAYPAATGSALRRGQGRGSASSTAAR